MPGKESQKNNERAQTDRNNDQNSTQKGQEAKHEEFDASATWTTILRNKRAIRAGALV